MSDEITPFRFDITLSAYENRTLAQFMRDFGELLVTAGITEACELSLSLKNGIIALSLEAPVKPENWRQVLTGLPSVTQSKSDKETPVSN